MASQQQVSNTPSELRDKWQTPLWVFQFFDLQHNFDIDLAANHNNYLVDEYITEEMNSLTRPWHELGKTGWCNPPYSDIAPWLEKAWHEAQQGFASHFLVNTPNGENHYRDFVFGKASRITFINGRIPFVASEDYVIKGKNGKPDKQIRAGDEVGGNTRGSCLISYTDSLTTHTDMAYVDREFMRGFKC